ncbi:MAG: hypothetical protein J5802_09165 [Butyrivibrio sp.]|nr:hypothetical protein [Butyrivibrio sp.]
MYTNQIRIENEADSLYVQDGVIHAIVNNMDYPFMLSAITRITAVPTNIGDTYNIVSVSVFVGYDTVICIMSDHRSYTSFLFDQLGKMLPINFQRLNEAGVCKYYGEFEIYVNMQMAYASYVQNSIAGEEKKLCNASLICWIAAHVVGRLMLLIDGSEYTGKFAVFFSAGLCIAGYVLAIMAIVKNPKSKYAKTLIIVYIAEFVLAVLAVVIIIVTCVHMLEDCSGIS